MNKIRAERVEEQKIINEFVGFLERSAAAIEQGGGEQFAPFVSRLVRHDGYTYSTAIPWQAGKRLKITFEVV